MRPNVHTIGRHGRILVILLLAVLGLSAAARAYWVQPSKGSASGRVASLEAPTISGAVPGAGTVALAWTAVTPSAAGGTVSYYVSRDGGAASSACPGAASAGTQTSCTDTGVSTASHSYTVTAVWRSWTAKSTVASVQVTSGPATHLLLAPATTTPTAGSNDNLTITAQDASNNTVTSYTGSKSLTFAGASTIGVNHPTVTSNDGSTTNFATAETIGFANGVATTSGTSNGAMKLYKAETAKITVTDGSIGNGSGISVTVSPAAASAFTLPTPSTQTAGTPFNETLTALDAYGNTATGYNGNKAIVFTGPASSPSGEAPKYPASITFTSGLGTASITIYDAGSTKLGAQEGATISGLSGNFTVNGLSTTSRFGLSTPSPTAGGTFSETITAQDSYGNATTAYAGNKTLTFSGPAKSPNGTSPKYPSSQVSFSSGVANTSVTLYDAQTTTLTATAPGPIAGTSASFTVVAASSGNFGLATPAQQTAGASFELKLTAQDSYGNKLTGYEGAKAVSFKGPATSPSGKAPAFPAVVNFSAGVGTASVTLYDAESGASIEASQGALTDETSSFTVNAAAAYSLSLGAESLNPSAGESDELTITAIDQFGNTATSYTGSKSLTFSGAATIGANHPTVTSSSGTATAFGAPTTISFTNGVAKETFNGRNGVMRLYAAETAQVSVTDTALSGPATALAVTVGVGSLTTFSLANPGTQTAGNAFNLTITAKDTYGNGLTGLQTVSFSGAAASPSEKAPGYPSSVTFTAGVATASVTLYAGNSTTSVTATRGASKAATGNFVVNAGAPARLAWSGAGSNSSPATEEGLCLFTCTWGGIGKAHTWSAKVSVTDANGNIVSNVGSGHVVSWTSGPSGGGSVSPSSLALPSSGIATTSSPVTYTSPSSWSSDGFTAHTSGYTDATVLLKK
jgi:hypothetical protein